MRIKVPRFFTDMGAPHGHAPFLLGMLAGAFLFGGVGRLYIDAIVNPHEVVLPLPVRSLAVKPTTSPSPTVTPAVLGGETKRSGTAATASTPAAAPGIGSRFGLSLGDSLPGLSSAVLAKRLDDIKSLGVSWIRLDLDWNDIQGDGAGQHNWGPFDNVVAAAGARGLHLLPILTATAPWARPDNCHDAYCPPADPAKFAVFAREATARYAPRGIHTWEIWNEENMASRWKPAADAGAYARLLGSTYPQIKQVDPSATVITGGLASTDSSDGNVAQLSYLNAMYNASAQPYFDAVGYHPYSFPVPASYSAEWNAWSKMSLTGTSFRSIMAAHGDSGKKIWATEYGATTGGPGAGATSTNYNLDAGPDHVDEALQAIIAVDVVHVTAATSWLGGVFWYSYQDLGTDRGDTENFYGLLRADGSQKPAYAAFKQALGGH
ncbi:MAG TPA: cellulase family glycosylhydrolase [Candidatus Saccharimonadia bacterium]|nr:cellulase family glycosylhydrolase [Candidatus Saccharimonadia bacterium]